MQDLLATPVRLVTALPNSENHGEQEDSPPVAVSAVATPPGLATEPPNDNHAQPQSPVAGAVSPPIRLFTPPSDETDSRHDSVVDLASIPACSPLASLPCDNTGAAQDPVAKAMENEMCPCEPCRNCRGLSKNGKEDRM